MAVTTGDQNAQAASGDNPFKLRNVRLTFYITTAMLTIWSFSFGATFDAYLLELARHKGDSDPNSFVGSVETVRGMITLVLSLPLGLLSDKMNRRRLLRYSSALGTLGIALLCWGIATDSIWLIYAGVVAAALFMQIYMTCGQALLADSVPKAKLTEVMATQGSLYLVGYSVGPLAQMLLIAGVGDVWNLAELHIFLCVGFCLWPVVIPAFFFFERTPQEREAEELRTRLTAGDDAPRGGEQPQGAAGPTAVTLSSSQQGENWNEVRVFGVKKKWLVPLLIELCSLITAIGAGMTVKFFPLFFKEDYHFQPMALCGLSSAYTLSIAFFVQLCKKLSGKIGRCQAALLWQVLGTVCLFALYKADPLPLVVGFYIIRGSFMNAAGPINQAIIMDCVDSKFRGRWSAIQSISRFSWSGSAILGGWLADSHDYRYTFLITGLIYAVASVFYIPLIFLVPSQTAPPAAPSARASQPTVLREQDKVTADPSSAPSEEGLGA